MRRPFISLAAAVLTVGVLTVTTAQAAPSTSSPATGRATPSKAAAAVPDYDPPPVTFGPCSSARLAAAGAQCGTVVVPLDYAKPTGATIRLAISRIKHKSPDSQYQGLMLVNPGGPGGSGLGLSTLQSRVPNGGGNDYDWIGFDPRGVGSSDPSLTCDKGYAGYNRPYYVPTKQSDEAAWLRKSSGYAIACARAHRDLLAHMSTVDSARDMDSIRKALGEPKISFYGFDYGTYLGSVYATMFPDKVRRMVLDSVVDPTRLGVQTTYDQDVAAEKNIKVFFDWVARYDNVYHLGTTEAAVEKKYYDQYQKLRTAPAGGQIGSSEWNDIFAQAAFYVFGWEDIASAFSRWVNDGDPSGLLALYPPPTDDNTYAAYLGVRCSDSPWPTYKKYRQDNVALYSKAPFLTWGNAWYDAPCVFSPVKGKTPVTVDGSTVPPILLISETLDALRPYSGALKVRELFPQARLVEGVGGTTNSGSLKSSTCVDNAVSSYLSNGNLPARRTGDTSDAQCAPNPKAVPTGVVR